MALIYLPLARGRDSPKFPPVPWGLYWRDGHRGVCRMCNSTSHAIRNKTSLKNSFLLYPCSFLVCVFLCPGCKLRRIFATCVSNSRSMVFSRSALEHKWCPQFYHWKCPLSSFLCAGTALSITCAPWEANLGNRLITYRKVVRWWYTWRERTHRFPCMMGKSKSMIFICSFIKYKKLLENI